MKILKNCLCFASVALLVIIPAFGQAQDSKPKPAAKLNAPAVETPTQLNDAPVRQQIDDFFALLQKRDVETAYTQLVKGTKIAERSEEVSTLKSKTQQAIDLFGEFQGHELIDAKSVGAHLLAVTYMSLGKNFPLRWRFYFYKPADVWQLIDIRVDDRLADMFGETTPPDERTGNWPRQE